MARVLSIEAVDPGSIPHGTYILSFVFRYRLLPDLIQSVVVAYLLDNIHQIRRSLAIYFGATSLLSWHVPMSIETPSASATWPGDQSHCEESGMDSRVRLVQAENERVADANLLACYIGQHTRDASTNECLDAREDCLPYRIYNSHLTKERIQIEY